MIYLQVILSLCKVIWIKVFNWSRIKIDPIQQLGKGFSIQIGKIGKVSIGRGLKSRRNCSLICDAGTLEIGKNVFLNQNVMITCEQAIKIGNGVTIANNVVIVDHDHDYSGTTGGFVSDCVSIGENTWIGANAVILKGTSIGKECVVAAGTVVRKGIYPDCSLIFDERVNKCVQRRR